MKVWSIHPVPLEGPVVTKPFTPFSGQGLFDEDSSWSLSELAWTDCRPALTLAPPWKRLRIQRRPCSAGPGDGACPSPGRDSAENPDVSGRRSDTRGPVRKCQGKDAPGRIGSVLLPGILLHRVTPWAGGVQTKLTPSWLFPTGAVTAHAAQGSGDETGSEQRCQLPVVCGGPRGTRPQNLGHTKAQGPGWADSGTMSALQSATKAAPECVFMRLPRLESSFGGPLGPRLE